MFDTLDDYAMMVSQIFGHRVSKAVMRLNGLCYCGQCKEKLMELYTAMLEQRREGARA